jgi:hypothetical protein
VKKPNIIQSWEDYQAPKTVVFWACVASVLATIVVGFGWGGWTRGSTAEEMATTAATSARAELAAAICEHGFMKSSNATSELATLKGADSWKRNGLIEAGGWVTLPGGEKPVSGAAELCVQRLTAVKATTS